MAICAMFGCFLCSSLAAAPGQLDPTFGNAGRAVFVTTSAYEYVADAVMQSDGSFVVAATCEAGNAATFCLTKIRTDGTLDPNFGSAGFVFTKLTAQENQVASVTVQHDGKILAAGYCMDPQTFQWQFCAARYNHNGTLDAGFANNGTLMTDVGTSTDWAYSILNFPDDSFLLGGGCYDGNTEKWGFCIAKFLPGGQVDTTFGQQGKVITDRTGINLTGYALTLQSTGRIILAGKCALNETDRSMCMIRYESNGTVDHEFGVNGIVKLDVAEQSTIWSARTYSDDRLLLAGRCMTSGTYYMCLVRLDSEGHVDTAFGANGVVVSSAGLGFDYAVRGELAFDGTIVLSGSCSLVAYADHCVLRFLAQGGVDGAFGDNGLVVVPSGGIGYLGAGLPLLNGKVVTIGNCWKPAYEGGGDDICAFRLRGGPYNPLTCALNADANQTIDPATDALLLNRYLLGFRRDALTTGALGHNPTRTGQALEAHLATLNLDADGDGHALAMTDGLLMLRAMLGLTGDALTQGATNASHLNVRNAQQILTWIENTHGVACLP